MPYVDNVPHAGSAEVLFTGMYDEPAGTIARTVPRSSIQGTALAGGTTGQVAARLIPLPAGLVVKAISLLFGGTAAVGPTHWWAALTDIQLNVLAVSADQLTAAIATGQFSTLPVNSTVVPSTGGYYVVESVSTGTTQPTFAGGLNSAVVATPAPVAWGTAGTQILPPAIGSQLNGGVVTPNGSANIAAWLS